jgi:acetoin utilization deacetylase AcuC-like enzyme
MIFRGVLPVPAGSGDVVWLPLIEQGVVPLARAFEPRVCARLVAPVGIVLEGGYALGALGRSVAATLQALGTGHVPDATALPAATLTPIARQARTRLAEFWPRLPTGPT